jgi:two-component system chemotaxis sensor kinase CheA
MNGSLELDSELGRGSQVTIKLPLTVAIIQALLVEVQSATFAVPLASVIEAVKITKDDIKSVNGQAVLNLRERILPLIDLAQTFQIPHEHSHSECYVVVVSIGAQRYGVVVDRLRAQEEVVIKSLGDFLSEVQGVAGATITGDGKVVLILDMANLVQNVRGTTFASMH